MTEKNEEYQVVSNMCNWCLRKMKVREERKEWQNFFQI